MIRSSGLLVRIFCQWMSRKAFGLINLDHLPIGFSSLIGCSFILEEAVQRFCALSSMARALPRSGLGKPKNFKFLGFTFIGCFHDRWDKQRCCRGWRWQARQPAEAGRETCVIACKGDDKAHPLQEMPGVALMLEADNKVVGLPHIIIAAVAKNRSWAGPRWSALCQANLSTTTARPSVRIPFLTNRSRAGAWTTGRPRSHGRLFSGHITITRSWAGSRRDAESSPMTCFAKGSTGTVS